jgi:hypothetical protein
MEGESFAAIILDPEGSEPNASAEFLSNRTQLIAMAAPSGILTAVQVDTIAVKKETSQDRKNALYRFMCIVRNTGNVHCYVSGTMHLEKEAAPGIYKTVGAPQNFGNEQTYLLPDGRRAFELDVPNLAAGQYRAVVSVTYQREKEPLVHYQRLKLS